MDNLYYDRKMLKWLPFQSLTEQGKDILAIIEKQYIKHPPVLSEDQYLAMQYRFEEAYAKQEEVTITYLSNHRTYQLEGMILSADLSQGLIILNTGTLAIKQIIALK